MWKCKKCEKPVYFAERIQSLGFDWHPSCLVCKECGKKLHPGQHAEHATEPYCHHPCYGALFGPRLFGHGTRNECHGAFGKVNKVVDAERTLLDSKVKEFNQVYDGKPGEITCREVNGRVVLEGIMRVHWAVDCLIHLKQEDETVDPASAPLAGAGARVIGRTSVLLGTPSGVSRSRSNSSVNNSGPASDDSDDDEPLWRDDSPPATPRGDTPSSPSVPSTPSTPNPNWPPTPYPTLKPSSSSSKLASSSPSRKVVPIGIRLSGSSTDIASGPQCSPVLSYTHNAPPHAPISHPLSSFNATEDCEADSSSMFVNGNVEGDNHQGNCDNEGDNVKTLCKKSQEEIDEEEKWNQQSSSVLADDFEYGGSQDSRYATMKTRTVRRRKDIDKAVTHSMRDSLLFLDKDGTVIPAEPNSVLNESSFDSNNASSLEANTTENLLYPSDVGRSDSITETTHNDTSNNNVSVTNGVTNTIKRANSIQKHRNNNINNSNRTSGIVKRVSFSQVDWNEKLGVADSPELCGNNTTNAVSNSVESGSQSPASGCGDQSAAGDTGSGPGTPCSGGAAENGDDGKSSASEGRRTPISRGKALLRRRPGRRMDKKKVKRRCSINGHLYLRETSSFHLDPDCPPAVVRVTSLTTTAQLITTILEKYKIEMSSSTFALYILKDNGEQRRLTQDEAPLTTRVMLGPHDSIAKIVLCDAKTTADITPEMAEFLHLSLAECRAILRQYEHEEQRQIRATRARYDEMKFYIQYWLEQMDEKEKNNGNAALAI